MKIKGTVAVLIDYVAFEQTALEMGKGMVDGRLKIPDVALRAAQTDEGYISLARVLERQNNTITFSRFTWALWPAFLEVIFSIEPLVVSEADANV